MTDSRPADPWKLARLGLLLAVMVAFLVAGVVGLVRGVPEAPYGWHEPPSSIRLNYGVGLGPPTLWFEGIPRTPDPLAELNWQVSFLCPSDPPDTPPQKPLVFIDSWRDAKSRRFP